LLIVLNNLTHGVILELKTRSTWWLAYQYVYLLDSQTLCMTTICHVDVQNASKGFEMDTQTPSNIICQLQHLVGMYASTSHGVCQIRALFMVQQEIMLAVDL
jgi:hypothetical protein